MRTEDFFLVLACLFITKEIVADSCTEQHFKEISSKIVSIIIIIYKYNSNIFFLLIYLQHLHQTQEQPETRTSLPRQIFVFHNDCPHTKTIQGYK